MPRPPKKPAVIPVDPREAPLTSTMPAMDRLARRYPQLNGPDRDYLMLHAVSGLDHVRRQRDTRVRDCPPASAQDALDITAFAARARRRLDWDTADAIDMCRRRGISWKLVALALGMDSPQAAAQLRRRLAPADLHDYLLDPEIVAAVSGNKKPDDA